MPIWIALFRGINVGGKKRMAMARLKSVLADLGCQDVETYIQSGNVVFRSRSRAPQKLATKIAACVESEFGFTPQVMLMSDQQLEQAIAKNPYPNAIANPKTLHLLFTNQRPESSGLNEMQSLASPAEQFALIEQVLYLHTPEGFGRSKLAASAERKLRVTFTARNYATVKTVASMAEILKARVANDHS